jgi:hypothetical protein
MTCLAQAEIAAEGEQLQACGIAEEKAESCPPRERPTARSRVAVSRRRPTRPVLPSQGIVTGCERNTCRHGSFDPWKDVKGSTMKNFARALGMTGAAIVLAGGIALAQAPTDEFTVEMMPVAAPFGELPVDGFSSDNVTQIVENMSAPQRDELQKRCTVVIANADLYGPAASDFCDSAQQQIISANEEDAEDDEAEDAAEEPT